MEIPLTHAIFFRDAISTQNTSEDDLSRLLVGKASDPALGNLEAKAFFNFSPPIETVFPTGPATLKSMELQLKFDFYSFGATDSSDLQLNVFEILDPLNHDIGYLNSTQIAVAASPIADTIIAPGPDFLKNGWQKFVDNDATNNITFTITIKLSGAIGQNLLNDLINDPTIFEDFSGFSSRYPGLAVTMPSGNKILGFTPVYSLPTPTDIDSKLILKYADDNGTTQLDFPIYYTVINSNLNSISSFTFVESDRTGGPLEGMLPYQDFISPDNQLYVQSGVGLLAKFELDKFYEYFDTIDNVVINSAEVVLENTSSLRAPQQIELLLLDSLNVYRDLFLDTIIGGVSVRVNDPYLLKIQPGIVPLVLSLEDSRVAILNELTNQTVSVDQTTGKIGLTIMTEFFQQIVNQKRNKRRAKAFAVHPVESEFEKTVSALKLDPSSAKLKIFYSKPLTSLP